MLRKSVEEVKEIVNEITDPTDFELEAKDLLQSIYPSLGFIPAQYTQRISGDFFFQDTLEEVKTSFMYYVDSFNSLRINNRDRERQLNDASYCHGCGRFITVNFRGLCSHCEETMRYCSECNELKLSHEIEEIVTENGKILSFCKECFKYKNYHRCDECNTWYKGEAVKIPVIRQLNNTLEYKSICQKCASKSSCKRCGAPSLGNDLCFACIEENRGMQPYNYKPIRPKFHVGEKIKDDVSADKLLFGFELEVVPKKNYCVPNESMCYIIKHQMGVNDVYTMEDGSISSGVEIASYPFSWDFFKSNRFDKIVDMLLLLKDYDYGASSDAGIHIHTTKKAWGTFQIYKLLKFFSNKRNREFLYQIGGRRSNMYCHFEEIDGEKSRKEMAKLKHKKDGENHYGYLNLNTKDGQSNVTIEFRMFSSTVEPYYFIKDFEFVKAMYDFTASNTLKRMTVYRFKRFVKGHKEDYPTLEMFIENIKENK